MDLSGSAGGSYPLLPDSGTVQNYTCPGTNLALKLNWTITNGTTLNLNNDLALTSAGRTLASYGTVNMNGNTVQADLIAGNGTIRNQGGGSGKLMLGGGNGNNTLNGSPALLDGTSGSLTLTKQGSGALTTTAPQVSSARLSVTSGTVVVNNTTSSGP